MAATFLGRMCLSGAIERLSPTQWTLTCHAMALYRRAWQVIDRGASHMVTAHGGSRRHPTGVQALLRTADDGRLALAVVHAMPGSEGSTVTLPLTLPLTGGPWHIADTLRADGAEAQLTVDGLRVHLAAAWTAQVVLLERA